MPVATVTANSTHVNTPLDSFLFQNLGNYKLTKPQIKNLIQNGFVTKNNVTVSKVGFKVKAGDTFVVTIETEEEIEKEGVALQKAEEQQQADDEMASSSMKKPAKKNKKKSKMQRDEDEDAEQPDDKQEQQQDDNKADANTPPQHFLKGKSFPLKIIYDDAELAVIEKPAGLIVHPAPHNVNNANLVTLAHALVHHFGHEHLSHIPDMTNEEATPSAAAAAAAAASNAVATSAQDPMAYLRPGIVHRIDADTSGLIVIAKTDATHLLLKAQFAKHSIARKYRCLVFNEMLYDEGIIESEITRCSNMPSKRNASMLKHILPGNENADFNVNTTKSWSNDFYNNKSNDSSIQQQQHHKNAKFARTHYKTIERFTIDSQDFLPKKYASQNKLFKFALVECELETGRTHQIRVHLSAIGRPLLGDRLYGSKQPKKPTIESMVLDVLLQAPSNSSSSGSNSKKQAAQSEQQQLADSVNGGQLLHAAELGFEHPVEKKEMKFTSEPPQNFVEVLTKLREGNKKYAKRVEDETDSLAY